MKRVLIAVDFSDVTGKVVNEGVMIAKAFNAEVCLLHTEPPCDGFIYYDSGYSSMGSLGYISEFNPDFEKGNQEKIESDKHSLDILKGVVENNGIKATTTLIDGDVCKAIIEHAKDYDLVVIGSHRHGKLYKLLFDDISTLLLSKTSCPVLIVPIKK